MGTLAAGDYPLTITATQGCVVYSQAFNIIGTGLESQAGTTVPGDSTFIQASSTPGMAGTQNFIFLTSNNTIQVNNGTPFGVAVTQLYKIGGTVFQRGSGQYYQPVTASGGGTGPVAAPQPTVSLSGSTNIASGSPAGTVIGTLSTAVGAGSYTFTYSLSDNTNFQLSGTTLSTKIALANGNYPLTILSSSSAILHSPFTLPVTISVGAAVSYPAIGYSGAGVAANDPVAQLASYPNGTFTAVTIYNGYGSSATMGYIGNYDLGIGNVVPNPVAPPYISLQVSPGPFPSVSGVAFDRVSYVNNALGWGQALGQNIVAIGESKFASINVCWEFNQGGASDFGWDGNPSVAGGTSALSYIAYFIEFFQNFVTGIRQYAKNVIICYSGNQYNNRTGSNDMGDYYPGDAFCQGLAFDPYMAFSNGIPPSTNLQCTYGFIQVMSGASYLGPNHPAKATGQMTLPVSGRTVSITTGKKLWVVLAEWQDDGNPAHITSVMNWLYAGAVSDRALVSAYWLGYSVGGGDTTFYSNGAVTTAGIAYANGAAKGVYNAPFPIPPTPP